MMAQLSQAYFAQNLPVIYSFPNYVYIIFLFSQHHTYIRNSLLYIAQLYYHKLF